MIDVENLVFNTVYDAVHAVYPDVNVEKGFNEELATFPCVVIRETNNVPVQRTITDDCAENHTQITYQVDVYSDKAGTARTECKELLKVVDDAMTDVSSMKFRRTHTSEALNIKRTIFRQYARYTVIVGKGVTTSETVDGEVVTTTTFQMYRR